VPQCPDRTGEARHWSWAFRNFLAALPGSSYDKRVPMVAGESVKRKHGVPTVQVGTPRCTGTPSVWKHSYRAVIIAATLPRIKATSKRLVPRYCLSLAIPSIMAVSKLLSEASMFVCVRNCHARLSAWVMRARSLRLKMMAMPTALAVTRMAKMIDPVTTSPKTRV